MSKQPAPLSLPVIVENGELMSSVAEVRVGASRVVQVMNSCRDEQRSHFRVIQNILKRGKEVTFAP